MGRKPNLSSPVAVIRHALGLDAADFAALIGCGTSTIQHVEIGDRPLKEELADRIHLCTGIPRDWLFKKDLSLGEVQGWMSGSAIAFRAKTKLEHNTSGGILFIGESAFPTADIMPLLTATFYSLSESNINPHLLILALTRATRDVAARFHIDTTKLKALQREMHRHYFPTPDAARREFEFQVASPGFSKSRASNQKLEGQLERTETKFGRSELRSTIATLRTSIAQRGNAKRRKRAK